MKDKLYTPLTVVLISTTLSVLSFLLYSTFFTITDYKQGLLSAIFFPAIISLPISLYTTRNHKKLIAQKKELENLNELNNKLFSVIAHDIRGPIAIIKGFVEILIEEKNNTASNEKHLETISRRIDHLLLFLNDLLNWSKNQIDTSTAAATLFKSKDIINDVLETYDGVRVSKNIHLNLEIDNKEIYFDKNTYAFVLRNIFHNAIKFTPKDGTISINTIEINNEIHTIIKDNGIGISAENINKIKNSKEWFTTMGTENETGTGFGIKTSIQYLHQQNGNLLIESEEGQGTKMSIILPKVQSN